MASKTKKVLTVVLVLTAFFALSAGALGYFLGVFSPVMIDTQVRGPYQMVYMLNQGAYHKVAEKIEKVGKMLDEKHVPKTFPCAIFYDDPRDVPLENLRSEGGYLVEDQRLPLEHPFGQREIPKRSVIVATTKANPVIAAFKTYGRLVEFMQMHSLEHDGPAMERYLPGGIVEVEMPFSSSQPGQMRNTVKVIKSTGHQKVIPAHPGEVPGHPGKIAGHPAKISSHQKEIPGHQREKR